MFPTRDADKGKGGTTHVPTPPKPYETRDPKSTLRRAYAWPGALLLVPCVVATLTSACGEDGTQGRAPSAGAVHVPQARISPTAVPLVLGSLDGSEIQGVRERYVVPRGSSEFSFSVKVLNAQKRTPVKVLFETPNATLPAVAAQPNYNAATVTVPLSGAPEGVHLATVGALYDGDERGPVVTFEIQIGTSTAPARAAQQPPSAMQSDPTASTSAPGASPSVAPY